MRLTRIAATTLIAGSLAFAGTGVALADTVTPVTSTSSSAVSAASVVSEPGVLTLSASSVKPGAQITFSGTFAEPAASTATGPITVTSPAFAGPATLLRSNPEAFDGSATIASSARPGTYAVTASSSAGTVTSRITVVGAVPPPVPAHHSTPAAGTHTAGHHSATEQSTDTSSTDAATVASVDPAAGPDLLPWVLGSAGLVVLAGGGAYALGRGRRSEALPNREDDREPRTEVMTRR